MREVGQQSIPHHGLTAPATLWARLAPAWATACACPAHPPPSQSLSGRCPPLAAQLPRYRRGPPPSLPHCPTPRQRRTPRGPRCCLQPGPRGRARGEGGEDK